MPKGITISQDLRQRVVEAYKAGQSTMQAIRLLRTGIEVLETGNLMVDRREVGDADQLMAIKRGDFNYDQVMAIANNLNQGLEKACEGSQVPKDVDRAAINQLCIDLVTQQGW